MHGCQSLIARVSMKSTRNRTATDSALAEWYVSVEGRTMQRLLLSCSRCGIDRPRRGDRSRRAVGTSHVRRHRNGARLSVRGKRGRSFGRQRCSTSANRRVAHRQFPRAELDPKSIEQILKSIVYFPDVLCGHYIRTTSNSGPFYESRQHNRHHNISAFMCCTT